MTALGASDQIEVDCSSRKARERTQALLTYEEHVVDRRVLRQRDG